MSATCTYRRRSGVAKRQAATERHQSADRCWLVLIRNAAVFAFVRGALYFAVCIL